jgi:hypothetical protein
MGSMQTLWFGTGGSAVGGPPLLAAAAVFSRHVGEQADALAFESCGGSKSRLSEDLMGENDAGRTIRERGVDRRPRGRRLTGEA